MPTRIGWIVFSLTIGTAITCRADDEILLHLPCESLHRAEHALFIGDFARCITEVQQLRRSCSHPTCLLKADALEQQCEARAMASLLATPTISTSPMLTVTGEVPSSTMPINSEKLSQPGGHVPTARAPSLTTDSVNAPPELPAHTTAPKEHKAAPDFRTIQSLAQQTLAPAKMSAPLVIWTIPVLLAGVMVLQVVLQVVLLMTRRRSPQQLGNGRSNDQIVNDGGPCKPDVFAQIMLTNVHLRELQRPGLTRFRDAAESRPQPQSKTLLPVP